MWQHDVVLNYLQTHAFASTTRTLAQGRPGIGSKNGAGTDAGGVTGSESNGGTAGSASDEMDVDEASGPAAGLTVGSDAAVAGSKGKDKKRDGVHLSEEDLVAIERRQGAVSLFHVVSIATSSVR